MRENKGYVTYVRQLLLEMKEEVSDKLSPCYVRLDELEDCIKRGGRDPKLLQNRWFKAFSAFSGSSALKRLQFPDFRDNSFLICNPLNPDFLTYFPKSFLDLFRKEVSLCFSPEKNWVIQGPMFGGVHMQQTRSQEDSINNFTFTNDSEPVVEEAHYAWSLQRCFTGELGRHYITVFRRFASCSVP